MRHRVYFTAFFIPLRYSCRRGHRVLIDFLFTFVSFYEHFFIASGELWFLCGLSTFLSMTEFGPVSTRVNLSSIVGSEINSRQPAVLL